MAEKPTPKKEEAARRASPPRPERAPGDGSPSEVGGRKGPEPTRYGDWEVKGICSDF